MKNLILPVLIFLLFFIIGCSFFIVGLDWPTVGDLVGNNSFFNPQTPLWIVGTGTIIFAFIFSGIIAFFTTRQRQ